MSSRFIVGLESHKENQKYSNYFQPLNQNIYQIIESRLVKLERSLSNCSILDFGCNVGNLLITAEGKIPSANYVGLDVFKPALVVAQKRFPDFRFVHYNKYNNTFNPYGIYNCPIPVEGKFDIIICYGVFTHFFMSEIKDTLKELRTKLNKNGIIIFSIWEDEDYPKYLNFLEKQFKIKLKLPEPLVYNNGFVLTNRNKLLIDEEKPIEDCYCWVEAFYKPGYILTSIAGSKKISGLSSFHPVYFLEV